MLRLPIRFGDRPLVGRALAASMLLAASCDRVQEQPNTHHQQPVPATEPSIVGASARIAQVGETASSPFFDMIVKRVKTCSVEAHFQPPIGVRKLGVEVELIGKTEAQVPANPFYALLSTQDGERFEATLAGCKPVLKASQVTEGERVSGWITFDVPDSARGTELHYAPVIIGGGRPELVFSLAL